MTIHDHSQPHIRSTDGTGELVFPKFSHLKNFAFTTNGGETSHLDEFLKHIKSKVQELAVKHRTWCYPSPFISVRHLTHLDIGGVFEGDSFDQVLSNGYKLETLRLSCELRCVPSVAFRAHVKSLPFLRNFAFWVTDVVRGVKDTDLFPALTEFIRSRQSLRLLTVGCGNQYFDALGFNASAWGAFPSLQNLLGLTTSLPSDVAPPMMPLFSWMLPRNLQYLNLGNAFASCGSREFLTVRFLVRACVRWEINLPSSYSDQVCLRRSKLWVCMVTRPGNHSARLPNLDSLWLTSCG